MYRAEIKKKFDEIVAFAEVEKFLDTPVKRYSSGMYVRLAFAVAAHLEPEILIVDEVLAVGDVQFQKKCLGKMKDVAGHGRTVLFVSHHLSSIRELCHSVVLLKNGEVEITGDCRQVIAVYMGQHSQSEPLLVPRPSVELIGKAYVTGVTIEAPDGRPALSFPVGQPWQCRVRFTVTTPQKNLVLGIGIVSAHGTSVQTAWSEARSVCSGEHEVIFEQDRVILEAGSYSILIGLTEGGRHLQQFEAARIEFECKSELGDGPYQKTSGVGFVINSMKVNWK
jgi:lipopolysaccharide transport system ATP-binding protein